MNKLISFIIPVYNVEKYIKKCALSLINQIYTNCEFIFVNDGSTDKSANIIKEIKDERIKLINQENQGVSVARNKGILEAKGEYIIFVDGDDFISRDYTDYMLKLIEFNDGDFAFSITNFKSIKEKQVKEEFIKEISSDEAIAYLLSPDVTVGCWNKIYKASYLKKNKILFLTDLYYGEGLSFITEVANKTNKIVVGNRKVYFYRKNNINSATTKFEIGKYHNGIKSLQLIEQKINLKNKKVNDIYLLHISMFYLSACVKIIEHRKQNIYKKDYIFWKYSLRKNLFKILMSRYISLYRKCMILGGVISPYFVSLLNIMREKRIFKQSIR